MTPFEWIVALAIIWWVIRGGLSDLVLAMRGSAPPRVSEGRARAAAGGRRYGMRDYFADLREDAWRTARAKREARLEQRLEHIREHGPGPTWRQRAADRWSAAWGRWETRLAERKARREQQEREANPHPEPVAPAGEPAGGPDRPHHPRDHDQDPHVNQDQDQAGQRREPADPVEPVTTTPYDPDQKQEPQELAAYRGPDGRWHVVDPDAGPTDQNPKERDEPMSEVTGLMSALAHASDMEKAFAESTAGAEQYLASLQAGGVSGEAITAVAEAIEAQQRASDAWGRARATLDRHTRIKEEYEANPDAGDKQFVMAE